MDEKTILKALAIAERNVSNGYITDPWDDLSYLDGYKQCLEDISFYLLPTQEIIHIRNKTQNFNK